MAVVEAVAIAVVKAMTVAMFLRLVLVLVLVLILAMVLRLVGISQVGKQIQNHFFMGVLDFSSASLLASISFVKGGPLADGSFGREVAILGVVFATPVCLACWCSRTGAGRSMMHCACDRTPVPTAVQWSRRLTVISG